VALFHLLQTSAPFRTASRRWKSWTETPDQPAIYQVENGEEWKRTRGLPPIVTLEVDIFLYSNVGADPNVLVSPAINALIKAVATALTPSATADVGANILTLGGLVFEAWISGRVEIREGMLAGQAIAMIPVKILIP
jgi:hypothetical protein